MFPVRRATLLVRSLAVIGFAAAAGGCGIASGAGNAGAGDIGGSGVAAQNPARLARAGTTVGVSGNSGEKLNVTVTKIVDPAIGATDFDQPDPGTHFVAVQFKLTNAGSAVYNDSPDLDARVLDAKGQSYDSVIADTAAGPGFAGGQVSIAPGATELGFVTFQVPDGTAIADVQFTTDTGLGQTAEWRVR